MPTSAYNWNARDNDIARVRYAVRQLFRLGLSLSREEIKAEVLAELGRVNASPTLYELTAETHDMVKALIRALAAMGTISDGAERRPSRTSRPHPSVGAVKPPRANQPLRLGRGSNSPGR